MSNGLAIFFFIVVAIYIFVDVPFEETRADEELERQQRLRDWHERH